jgi:ABC-2 type transport system ATP-binding protein
MWAMVRSLRATGVTIILTTHYIEEAQQMADRIGVINKGEIILVDEKASLMDKLGKKELILYLERPLREIPAALAAYRLDLAAEGSQIVYTFHADADRSRIAALLRDLAAAGVDFNDLKTRESSLEEIFVSLVKEDS